jgi:hypothetical protein
MQLLKNIRDKCAATVASLTTSKQTHGRKEPTFTGSSAETDAPANEPYIQHNKKTYSIDILWLPAESPTTIKKEATEHIKNYRKQEANEAPDDLYAIRPLSSQFGIASTHRGHKPGYISAATLAADNPLFYPSAIAFVQISKDNYWIVGIKNGEISAGTDRRYESLDAAIEAFERNDLDEYQKHYSSPSIAAPNTLPIEIAQILDGPGGSKLYHYEHDKRLAINIVAGICILSIAAYGYNFYSAYKVKKIQEEAARIARLSNPMPPEMADPPVPPWKSLASQQALIINCSNAIASLDIRIVGWDLESIRCEQNNGMLRAEASYSRKNGIPDEMTSILQAKKIPMPVYDDNRRRATTTRTIDISNTKMAEPSLRTTTVIKNIWTDLAPLGITPETSSANPNVVKNRSNTAEHPFTRRGYNITLPSYPTTYGHAFSHPGMTTTKITYSPQTKKWTVEGYNYDPLTSP